MSGVRTLLQAAIAARLSATLTGVRVLDAPPGRIGGPFAVVDEPVLTDWSTKTWAGREGRLIVLLYDGGERPVRLRGVCDAVEAALADPPPLAEGWRIVRLSFVRSRMACIATDRWTGTVEFQVRVVREDS
ncbi:DUF3168 domain-containing protein [uncultured Sphingomonas sp.]|uniref:DUF3168 domain-containing protein n=1 Tax=uncultured Sphingomonas sp. TaxID=158754 RepID=UPI0035CAEBCE